MALAGLYPGTFDPITNGHADIMRRACRLTDGLVIAVAISEEKGTLFSLDERVSMVEAEAAGFAREHGTTVEVRAFKGLLVDLADEVGADIIVRGLRGAVDYEYEAQMVGMNSTMNPRVETVFLAAAPDASFITATLVRQIARMGGDIDPFVPPEVAKNIKAKLAQTR